MGLRLIRKTPEQKSVQRDGLSSFPFLEIVGFRFPRSLPATMYIPTHTDESDTADNRTNRPGTEDHIASSFSITYDGISEGRDKTVLHFGLCFCQGSSQASRFIAADLDMGFSSQDHMPTSMMPKSCTDSKGPVKILSVQTEKAASRNEITQVFNAKASPNLLAIVTRWQNTSAIETHRAKFEHTDVFINGSKVSWSFFENSVSQQGLYSQYHIAITLERSTHLGAMHIYLYAKALTSDHTMWKIGEKEKHAQCLINLGMTDRED